MAAEDRRSTGDALLGRTIAGKFTIESRVGGGGMGSVYRARQAGLDKIVAVKVLHRELLAEPTFASRFKREATSASRIDHPSSLRVLDFGEEPDGLLYIAMEYLEGRTLFKVLREEAPLAPARIVDLSRQILAALAAAHDIGIVHRDLKPENVIILSGKDDDGGATEHVKVCDFGIAKLQTEGDADEKLTLEGSIVGTPEYLSPEQARGGQLDARSDLYSMGVILFEMLTGQPPFRGDTPLAIVLKHLDAVPPRPSTLNPAADPKLEVVCLKALSKAPADRYATAREMRVSLSTDSNDASNPPPLGPNARISNLLVMTETPPPVSSTQVPVPLMSKRSSALGSGSRPRLSELSEEPASSGSSRAMALVIAVALIGGGGGAYWLRKGAPRPSAPAVASVHETAAPSATEPAITTPPSASSAAAPSVAPLDSSTGAVVPPPASPSAAPTTTHRKGKGAKGAAGEVVADDSAPTAATTANVAVAFQKVDSPKMPGASISGALSVARLKSCYHGAPGSHATALLHLDIGKTGKTAAKCTIVDSDLSADLAACIEDTARHASIHDVPADGATADLRIDLSLPP
jgi:serine/threonine protein kinase